MKRKFVAVLMTLVMGLGLTGCSSGNEEAASAQDQIGNPAGSASASQISEKLIEPRIFLMADSYTGNEEVFKAIEYYTNIKFKVIPVPRASYTEKLSTTIASGDIPDLMSVPTTTIDKYGPEGAFVSLGSYIEQGVMPDFIKVMEDNPPAMQLAQSADGEIYGAPRVYDVDYRADQMMLARVDILEKHGLSRTPETFDDFYNILKQLKELYPDSTPYVNRWGIEHLLSGPATFSNTSYTYFLNQETSQYEYGPSSQAYKDCLEFLAKLYREGLLNPDFATLTDAEVDELLVSGKGFVTFDYPQWGDELVVKMGDQLPEGFAFQAMLQPKYNGKLEGTPVLGGYAPYTKAVAAGSKYEEELMKFINWTYSEEGINALMYGIEGTSYEIGADGKVKFLKDFKTPVTPEGTIQTHGLYDQHIYSVMDPLAKSTYEMEGAPNLAASTDFIELNNGFGKPVFEAKFFSEDDRKRYTDLMTPIDTYIKEASMKVILGEMNLDQWDAEVIPTVEKMGVKEAGDLKNKAYAETFNK